MALETLEGQETPQPEPQVKVQQGGLKSPYNIGKMTTAVGVDQSILEKMQELLQQKQAEKASYERNLDRAVAAAMPAPYYAQAVEAVNKQDQQRDADIFQMQNQIAQFRTAQEQAKRNKEYLQTLIGGAPTAGAGGAATAGAGGAALNIPEPVRQQMAMLSAKGSDDEAKKVFDDWFKTSVNERVKLENNPSAYKKEIEIVLDDGRIELVDTFTAMQRVQSGSAKLTDRGQQKIAEVTAAPTTAAPAKTLGGVNNPGNIVDPKTGLFRNFDTPGKGRAALEADLQLKISGQSGAFKRRFGDAEVTPERLAETWSPAAAPGNSAESTTNYGNYIAKRLGINPGDKIENTPENLKKVADAISEFESGRRAPAEPVRLAAAPSQTRTDVTAPTTGKQRPTLYEAKQEAELKKKESEAEIEARKDVNKKALEKHYEDTDPVKNTEQKNISEEIKTLVTKTPQVVGVLNKFGMGNALAKLAEEGLTTPIGTISIPLSEAILRADPKYKGMKGNENEYIEARSRLASLLQKNAANFSSILKGSGSVSNYERDMVAQVVGTLKDSPGNIIKIQDALIARSELNLKLNKAFADSGMSNINTFKGTKEYQALINEYHDKLSKIANSPLKVPKPESAAAPPSSGSTSGGTKWRIVQ